jgi:hypothetical protein
VGEVRAWSSPTSWRNRDDELRSIALFFGAALAEIAGGTCLIEVAVIGSAPPASA